MQKLPAPDFPTGGLIMGLDGAKDLYKTGQGSITVRARTHTETIGAIIVTELPYSVSAAWSVRPCDWPPCFGACR